MELWLMALFLSYPLYKPVETDKGIDTTALNCIMQHLMDRVAA